MINAENMYIKDILAKMKELNVLYKAIDVETGYVCGFYAKVFDEKEKKSKPYFINYDYLKTENANKAKKKKDELEERQRQAPTALGRLNGYYTRAVNNLKPIQAKQTVVNGKKRYITSDEIQNKEMARVCTSANEALSVLEPFIRCYYCVVD